MSVAIVGSGLAGFTAYATLRHGGLEPGEIVVFGMADDPAAAWRLRAAAIRQREMRSESDGHCLPTSFPGLAVRAAVRRRSARPLVESVLDRYHPSVDEFLSHVDELRERSGWDASLRRARIERPRGPVIHQEHAFRAPVRHFEQHGAIAMRGITRFQHVDVGRKLHESLFIARRLIDIRNDPVSRVGRIDGEIGFADETFVRTRGPE